MRLIAVAVAGLVTAGAGAASAQPLWGLDQGRFYEPERAPLWQRDRSRSGPIRPQQVAYLVESMGLDPVGPPLQNGHLIVQRAADEFGRIMRVTIDSNNGRVVSIAPAGTAPMNGRPYAGYGPYGPGPYARPAPEADDDDEFAPPGSAMAPRGALPPGAVPPPVYAPPRAAAPTYPPSAYPANPYPPVPPQADPSRPQAKSATVTPAHPPQPRKRPENTQATKKAEPGSVVPLPATPAPAQDGKPAAPSSAMPPVAPLE